MTTIQIANAPLPVDDRNIDQKLADLERIIGSMSRVLVGYSGGVDSAMLIVAAHRILGDEAIAVTADSESYASGELEEARRIIAQFGIRHVVVKTRELDNPDYAANPLNRCYYCKSELFTHMSELAEELGADQILYGNNADDVGDFRPGAQAAEKFGVRAPLQEAGLTKQDVRDLARRWQISAWDRPATACLSSRFPYGTPVTSEGLRMVDRAEAFLHGLGFPQLRVRHHAELARLELPAVELGQLLADPGLRERISSELADIGYDVIALDLRGFRSGSLNEVLKKKAASTEDGDLRTRARQLVEALGLGPCEAQERAGVLTLELPETAISALADADARGKLVRELECLGARFATLLLNAPDRQSTAT
jgi:uncharacterized protein